MPAIPVGAEFSMLSKVSAAAALITSSESKWTPTLKGLLKEQRVAGLMAGALAESSRLQTVPQIRLIWETTIAAPTPFWRLGMSR